MECLGCLKNKRVCNLWIVCWCQDIFVQKYIIVFHQQCRPSLIPRSVCFIWYLIIISNVSTYVIGCSLGCGLAFRLLGCFAWLESQLCTFLANFSTRFCLACHIHGYQWPLPCYTSFSGFNSGLQSQSQWTRKPLSFIFSFFFLLFPCTDELIWIDMTVMKEINPKILILLSFDDFAFKGSKWCVYEYFLKQSELVPFNSV